MTYILKRTDGMFVARAGSHNSYTAKLQGARTFPTIEAAERDRCVDNEHILRLEDAVR